MNNSFYFAVIFIVIISSVFFDVMICRISPLSRHDKNGFIISYLLISVCALFEGIQVMIDGSSPDYRLLHYAVVFIEFSLSPLVPALFLNIIRPGKSSKAVMLIPAVNFLLLLIDLGFHKIFYVDNANIYHRGEFVFVYPAVLGLSIISLLTGLILLNRDYYSRENALVIFIIVLMIFGLSIQVLNRGIMIDWLVIFISSAMIYFFYSSLVSRCDALTHLLNRNTFENDCRAIKNQACFIYFDIDGFKECNDNHGHSYGDEILKVMAKTLIATYVGYAHIYRLGGDEFCVILTKKTDRADYLNDIFSKRIAQAFSGKEGGLTVSIGKGMFEPGSNTVKEALETADKKMYENKHSRQ